MNGFIGEFLGTMVLIIFGTATGAGGVNLKKHMEITPAGS